MALPLAAQDLPETDYTFYLRFEDDESNDVPNLPDYWGRPFEAVDAVKRYEDSAFRFDLVPLGGRNGRTDAGTPNALLDVFSSLHRQNPNYRKGGSGKNGKNGSGQDWHSRLNSDFFFHNKDHWYSGLWSVFSDMFSNEFTLKIDTDGYLAIDQFRLEIARPLTFFNTFWSFSDETRRTVNDAAGVFWTHNDIRYTFCGYGGFDFFGMTHILHYVSEKVKSLF
ncbi:MAG: hypothetical protein J6W76_01460, partial [Spirochaetales bacterium]|nr:hypothetical protein [Spirochaetales bacterium]